VLSAPAKGALGIRLVAELSENSHSTTFAARFVVSLHRNFGQRLRMLPVAIRDSP
jgi:hypothetical protein